MPHTAWVYRWFPGRFDVTGGAHLIFHMLVVFAATVWYNGLLFLAEQTQHGAEVCFANGTHAN